MLINCFDINIILGSIPLGLYIIQTYLYWKKEFAHRVQRSNLHSPSHGIPPLPKDKRDALRSFAQRTLSWSPTYHSSYEEEKDEQEKHQDARLREASKLDMDHHFIPFSYFLVFHTLVNTISLQFSAAWGLFKLIIRYKLHQFTLIEPMSMDPHGVVAESVLEGTLTIYYVGRKDNVASFVIEEFPYIKNGEFFVAKSFSTDIDLTTRKMVSAKLDENDLTAEETLIMICFYRVSSHHVKLHAFANWAHNIQDLQNHANPFLTQNSIVTTLYNHYGHAGFYRQIWLFKRLGLASSEWESGETIIAMFNHGLKDGVPVHSSIRDLAPYSRFVSFVVKLRPHFMKEFNKAKKKYFPGCHGEALFAGTVLHSLDHMSAEWVFKDPLWFDINHPEYRMMAECCRIVRCGFIPELYGIIFQKNFKGSNHPFHKAIYKKASMIDKEFADEMETCIIR